MSVIAVEFEKDQFSYSGVRVNNEGKITLFFTGDVVNDFADARASAIKAGGGLHLDFTCDEFVRCGEYYEWDENDNHIVLSQKGEANRYSLDVYDK